MNPILSNNNINPFEAVILAVDDEIANLKLVNKLLSSNGYKNIICTQDSSETIELYKKHKPDLILLDLDMPKPDGYEILKQLKQLPDDILPPVLVLTAQHMQSFRQRALDYGARDYVTKPFNINELLSRVRNLIEVQMAHKYMFHKNELLEKMVEQRTKDIHETRLRVIRHLGRAAEYRDNETGLHIIRMSKIAVVIAEAIGMSSYECDLLLNAAPMHDIGKIGIPDHILMKPGKLDPDEWEIMKSHVTIGADILKGDDSHLMKMAHDIALTHHERWNGKGYPCGLQGEDIPLPGRITSIADVFDALTSERPYKKAWSIEETLNLIRSESGQQFEPRLVESMMDNIDSITEIMHRYAEPGN